MKKILPFALISMIVMLASHSSFSQVPQSFKYQSVARNASGNLIASANIGLRISIRDLTTTGTVVYRETHTATTNSFGSFSISVGAGTVVSGIFSSIVWGTGAKFIEVEADLAGGTSYTSMGTSQLLSVPYALYSQNGTPGADGLNGLSLLNGTTNPAAGDGANGEFYINTASNTIFGPKAAGAWPAGVSLVGPPGSSANAWGLSGNAGTIDGTNFIGTTDNIPLTFKVNNLKAGTIEPGGSVFFGGRAGNSNTTSSNAGFGNLALYTNTFGTHNTAAGQASLYNNTDGDDNTASGLYSLYSNTTGNNNSAFGSYSLSGNASGNDNTAVGFYALSFNSTGNSNSAFGSYALYSNQTASQNTANGWKSLFLNTTGANNSAIGFQSLFSNTTGSGNDASGSQSLYTNTTGAINTAHGHQALYYNNSGDYNTATGNSAMYFNTSGANNTASGYQSLYNNTLGIYNTADGVSALPNNTTGNYNTAAGYLALKFNQTGSNNTAVGHNSFNTGTAYSNSTAIGANSAVNSSNQMTFGDANVTKWGFGVNPSAGNAIQVGTGATNGNGASLTIGGTWTNASDRNKKENFASLDGEDILSNVKELPITRWNYKGETASVSHIGPTAQDFYRLFQVGNNDKSISTIDPSGVALVAIQELIKQIDELKKVIDRQKLSIQTLKTDNTILKSDFNTRLQKLEEILGVKAEK